MPETSKANKTRRGHRLYDHWRVTITYSDNDQSGRVFNNREKAEKFAARQKRSPVVKSTEVKQVA